MESHLSQQPNLSAAWPELGADYRRELEARAWDLIARSQELPSPEVKQPERLDNARTALFEAMTASGHLSRVEISGSLEDINAQITSRLLNGWRTAGNIHEKQRRLAELCNELFIQDTHEKIIRSELPLGTEVTEISNYPTALDAKTARSLGYRSDNHKGMVRTTGLMANTDGTYTRVVEQVSRANGTYGTTYDFLLALGIEPSSQKPTDIAVLEAPFRHTAEQFPSGVIDVVRELDARVGESIMYGDSAPRAVSHVGYEQLRAESARREGHLDHYTRKLAAFEQNLDELAAAGKIDQAEKDRQYKDQVMRILNAICTIAPSYAEDTFGKKAASYYYEAAELVSQGDIAGAESLLIEAEKHKQSVTFCGVEISVEQAQSKGLVIDAYGNLVREGLESWQWKRGECRVPNCPSKPGEVKVGPCEVCEHCQAIYDKGQKPADVYPSAKAAGRRSILEAAAAPLRRDIERINQQTKLSQAA